MLKRITDEKLDEIETLATSFLEGRFDQSTVWDMAKRMALLDPHTILSLVAEIRALRDEIAALRKRPK